MGRNPKTGQSVMITARTIPCFKVSKEFKAAVNNGASR
jgi:nucleoid DNA-binding protein